MSVISRKIHLVRNHIWDTTNLHDLSRPPAGFKCLKSGSTMKIFSEWSNKWRFHFFAHRLDFFNKKLPNSCLSLDFISKLKALFSWNFFVMMVIMNDGGARPRPANIFMSWAYRVDGSFGIWPPAPIDAPSISEIRRRALPPITLSECYRN